MGKKFYWLKLKEDFFDDDTIAYIEEQENGIQYVNFYLKLCLKSIKTDGKLIRIIGENLIPYDVKSLSKLTGVPVDTVVVAMKLFESIGLVKILETGEIYLAQINEMIGSETDKAKLMRQKRAVAKLNGNNVTLDGNNVTEMLPQCYTEIRDKEIEIRDKEIEIRDKETNFAQNSGTDAKASVCSSELEPTTAHSKINYEVIKNLYNNICLSFPSCKTMSETRKKAIKARFTSGYKIDDFKMLFEKAEKSSFLKGNNDRNWIATFDWLIKDGNIAKVLDGNYDDRNSKELPPEQRKGDLDHLFN